LRADSDSGCGGPAARPIACIRDGLTAIERGRFEKRRALLNQAVQNNPHNMTFRLTCRRAATRAIQQADRDSRYGARRPSAGGRGAGLKRVLALDPNNDRAKRSLRRPGRGCAHGRSFAQARKARAQGLRRGRSEIARVRSEDPGYGRRRNLATRSTPGAGRSRWRRLKTRDNHKVTLQLRDAPTKMVFEVLSRETRHQFHPR